MRFERKSTQDCVDKFLEEIRNSTAIHIEDIKVEEKKFKNLVSKTIASTVKGKIFIDPENEIDERYFCLEHTVLHELGHRAQQAINPNWDNEICKGLIKYNLKKINLISLIYGFTRFIASGDFLTSYGHVEGVAECFSLDIFPNFCSISNKGNEFIKKARENHMNAKDLFDDSGLISKGYRFYHELTSTRGLDGIVSYIRDFSPEKVPSRAQFSNPQIYFRASIDRSHLVV